MKYNYKAEVMGAADDGVVIINNVQKCRSESLLYTPTPYLLS